MISKETITSRVQNIIKNSGMRAIQVARKANINQSTMSNWFNGKTNISLIQYIKICEACNIPNGVFDEGQMKPDMPAEVAEQATTLIKLLLELHVKIDDKDSPFELFVENARYMNRMFDKGVKDSDN